jgi:hypothetical protein
VAATTQSLCSGSVRTTASYQAAQLHITSLPATSSRLRFGLQDMCVRRSALPRGALASACTPPSPSLSHRHDASLAHIAFTRCAAIKGTLPPASCPRHHPPVRSGKHCRRALFFAFTVHQGQLGLLPPLLPMQVLEHQPAPGILPEPLELHLHCLSTTMLLSCR